MVGRNHGDTSFEFIIVDNDPGASIGMSPGSDCLVKVVKCEKEGAYAARNKGAQEARGEYLAFVDADCIFDDNWLVNAKNIIGENPDIDLVAGDVVLFAECHMKPNAFEIYDMILGINQRAYAKKGKSVTANLIIKKSVFADLRGFNDSRFSGSDHEFCERADKQGFRFGFFPCLIVYHPARNCMPLIANKAKRRVGGRIGVTKLKDAKAILITLLPPVVRFYKILFSKGFSWHDKKKAIRILFVVNKIQVVELYKILLLNKKKVR
ncbi:Glycosyltransferase like family 2 [Modicisalibacter ilicicola DSM 19980]|uniref:Glycosyltransferase like family 2 n=2 Tax=Modicisalibacter ilicicola TaxID=480814 RepID=A0A1M5BZH4_9GAMM|nr:Glycosyltransferase like family 2 [Halomonas ilicicola DSM 19980]